MAPPVKPSRFPQPQPRMEEFPVMGSDEDIDGWLERNYAQRDRLDIDGELHSAQQSMMNSPEGSDGYYEGLTKFRYLQNLKKQRANGGSPAASAESLMPPGSARAQPADTSTPQGLSAMFKDFLRREYGEMKRTRNFSPEDREGYVRQRVEDFRSQLMDSLNQELDGLWQEGSPEAASWLDDVSMGDALGFADSTEKFNRGREEMRGYPGADAIARDFEGRRDASAQRVDQGAAAGQFGPGMTKYSEEGDMPGDTLRGAYDYARDANLYDNATRQGWRKRKPAGLIGGAGPRR